MAGIDDALTAAGLSRKDVRLEVIEAPCTRAEGYKAGLRILAEQDRSTAVFALSDILAAGVLDAAYELGLDVPSLVSVAGYDDRPRPVAATAADHSAQPIEAKLASPQTSSSAPSAVTPAITARSCTPP